MDVIVYTYNGSDHLLPGFAYCFNKYWSPYQPVTVLGYRRPPALPSNFHYTELSNDSTKPFTHYLHTWFRNYREDYFVLFGDDHWISDYVDLASVATLEGAIRLGAVKANLSDDGRYHFQVRDHCLSGPITPNSYGAEGSSWKSSLQPAIWRTSYFCHFIQPPAVSPWEVEDRGRAEIPISIYDRVISCKHEVVPRTCSEGVMHSGQSYSNGIAQLHPADIAALEALGYSKIRQGDLT